MTATRPVVTITELHRAPRKTKLRYYPDAVLADTVTIVGAPDIHGHIDGHARIGGKAHIYGRVGGHARIGGHAFIGHTANIDGYADIDGYAWVTGLNGHAYIGGNTRLSGTVYIVGGNVTADVHLAYGSYRAPHITTPSDVYHTRSGGAWAILYRTRHGWNATLSHHGTLINVDEADTAQQALETLAATTPAHPTDSRRFTRRYETARGQRTRRRLTRRLTHRLTATQP